jgi:hypothetical protein
MLATEIVFGVPNAWVLDRTVKFPEGTAAEVPLGLENKEPL